MLIDNPKIRKPENPAHRCPPSAPRFIPPETPQTAKPGKICRLGTSAPGKSHRMGRGGAHGQCVLECAQGRGGAGGRARRGRAATSSLLVSVQTRDAPGGCGRFWRCRVCAPCACPPRPPGPKPPGVELERSVEVHNFGSARLEGDSCTRTSVLTKRPQIDGSDWRPPFQTIPLGRCLKPIG